MSTPAPKKRKLNRSWQDVAKIAQHVRDASLDEAFPDLKLPDNPPANVVNLPNMILGEDDARITSMTIDELLLSAKNVDQGLSATAIVRAFLRRAAVAQGLVRPTNSRQV